MNENRYKKAVIVGLRRLGLEPFVDVVASKLSEDVAYRLERACIRALGFRNAGGLLTNICEDNRPPSPKGRRQSEAMKRKLSEERRGAGNPMFGKRQGINAKTLMRARMSGGNNPFFGATHTEETINRILQTKRDKGFFDTPSPLKGRKRPDSSAMMSERWLVTRPDGGQVEVVNLFVFAKEVAGCHPESLRKSATYKSGKTRCGWCAVKIVPEIPAS